MSQRKVLKGSVLLVAVLCIALFAGCGNKDEDEATELGDDAAVAAGLSTLSAAVVADSGSAPVASYLFPAEGRRSWLAHAVSSFAVPSALATVTTCGSPAFTDTCSAGVKAASYTDCPIGNTGLTYSGTVTLTFSDSGCVFGVTAPNGSTLTRTLNMSRTGLLGSVITSTSDAQSDFRGNTISGGTKITKTAAGTHTIEVLGVNKKKTGARGKELFNVSTRSLVPFTRTLTGAGQYTVSSGTIEVIHNLARYTAEFTSTDLAFTPASCCYPVSGTVSGVFKNEDGSTRSTGSVTFGSCGTATLVNAQGTSTEVTLPGCQ